MKPVVYSSTSVSVYRECSLRWWFTYVACLDARPSYEQAQGIAVHAAAEKILRGKLIEQEVSLREAVAEYRLTVVKERRVPDAAGEALVALFLEVSRTINPMLVEQPFQLDVEGIPYSGILDWYDADFWLWDLKSIGSRPSARTAERYWFGQVGYALGARDLTSALERGRGLAYLVKTKTPYYWPVLSGPVTDDEIDRFAGILERTAERVERGIFEADGLFVPGACKTCPFTSECGPYQRRSR